MFKVQINTTQSIKFFFALSIIFIFGVSVYAQTLMKFEDAQEIAVNSVRRASGTRPKKLKFDEIKTYAELNKLVSKDEYLRNCLTFEEIWEIRRTAKANPDKKVDQIGSDSYDNKSKILNEKCFPQKRLRLTDSLSYLGVTDTFRLDALRRYIVRNTKFGVKRIWGNNSAGIVQPFIITNSQLENITGAATVLELAKTIQSNAALPFLSASAAETVVKNCRKKVRITDNPKDDIPLDTKIIDDLGKETKIESFVSCLEKAEYEKSDRLDAVEPENKAKKPDIEYGVNSVKVKDNSGNARYYHFLKTYRDVELPKFIKNQDSTYRTLIVDLTQNALLPPSADFLAARLVINAMLKVTQNENKSAVLVNPFEIVTVDELLRRIKTANCQPAAKCIESSTDSKLSTYGLKAENVIAGIAALSVDCKAGFYRLEDETDSDSKNKSLRKTLIPIQKVVLSPTRINEETEIEAIIEMVEIILEEQEKIK